MSFFSFLGFIPTISSTVFKHYTEGPPKKSWDLKFHLTIATIKGSDLFSKIPIEQAQEQFDKYNMVKTPPNITIKDVILDEEYRQKSQTYLEKILKQYDDVFDERWKDPNDKGLHGEWMYINEKTNETDNVILYLHGGGFYVGSSKSARSITQKFVELTDSRVFAPNYRLSPQSQFPAALCDCIAAYVYLINPGQNAGFESINPKRIILAGESAGGNLVFVTLLSLRDAGLPLPAGAIVLVDLTQSMPSRWNSEIDKVDYIPSGMDFLTKLPSSPAMDEYFVNAKALADKIALKNTTIVSHPSFTEVFTFSKPSQIAVERCCDFINRVTSIEDNNISMINLIKEEVVSPSISVSPSFISMRVGTDGTIRELNETDRDCLKWDKIGVVPKPEL
ncbi:31947_t:CDS:2 [Gigaspora margarita]|uniref:31947_t:CDS:1 n=1 Tax=Gigaspora margarita TaxID=4874 RepID=A0ABN7WK27_GIGMA|nr:31947_t:CDS:2 [Gigaspora margarita]